MKKEVVIIGVSLLIFGALISLSPKSTGSQVDSADLMVEFEGAYSASANPTGEVKTFEITAAESELEINGVPQKLFSYNGQIPGPQLRVKLGETVRLNFKNELPQETTIHFHGVRVPNAMDGVPGVNQEPVQPGGSFVYEFTPKDAGTFWFHPHVRTSEQMEKGLYGTLIVEGEYADKFNQDLTWVIDDWRLNRDGILNESFNTMHDLMHDGRWGNLITVNGEVQPIFSANPGERIRLRLVNASNGRVYLPAFPGLQPKIIAVDGMQTRKPISYSKFELSPGNRIDLDLTIPVDQQDETFTVWDNFTRYSNRLAHIQTSSNVVSTPSFQIAQAHVPSWKGAATVSSDLIMTLNASRGMHRGINWTINGKTFGKHEPLSVSKENFTKITLKNDSARLHPMHIHGQFFKVLSRNGKPVDEPYFQDTVLVNGRETVEIGLVALDEGEWATHCHILEHAEAGMMTTIDVS